MILIGLRDYGVDGQLGMEETPSMRGRANMENEKTPTVMPCRLDALVTPASIHPFFQDGSVTIYHGDAREIAPRLGGFDALISDPPYGIGYCHGARKGGVKMGTDCQAIVGDDQPFDPEPWLSYPVVILWGGNHFASRLPDSACWLVWDKRGGVASNDQADCELAWSNLKGVARLKTRYWNGAHAKEKDEKRVHSNQKPLDLMKWCIGLAGNPGLILDPFMGSGTTLRAAKDMGLQAVGIEIDERHCEAAARRMAQETLW